MSSKYKFHDPDGVYFVTFSVVKWVDVFTRDEYREIFLDSLRYCQREKGLVIHAWVIMTNHTHLIISKRNKQLLEHIMRDLKKFTSFSLIRSISKNVSESRKKWMVEIFEREGVRNSNNKIYQFWQQDNHPIQLTSNEMMDQKLDYIHNNPVKQGFVNHAEDFPWSSMRTYCDEVGKLEIEKL